MIPVCASCGSREIEYLDGETGEFIPDAIVLLIKAIAENFPRLKWFESTVRLSQPFFHYRLGPPLHFGGNSQGRKVATKQELAKDMGIDWMTRVEMGQSVPPAYSEYVGKQLLEAIS